MKRKTQISAQHCSDIIRSELNKSINEGLLGVVPAENNKELTIETLKKTISDTCTNLEAKRIIPTKCHDLKVYAPKDSFYKVTYRDQLNSVRFITNEDKIDTLLVKAEDEIEAHRNAVDILNKSACILDIAFDHTKEDNTRVNIDFYYKPIIAFPESIITSFIVKLA